MTTERDITPIVRSWLQVGPDALPDHVLEQVLDRLPATPQRQAQRRGFGSTGLSISSRIGLAAAIGLFAVLGLNVLPLWGGLVGTDTQQSPSPGPSASASPTARLDLEPPADVGAYVRSAYEGLVDLPALTITVVEQEGTKARYMYDGAGLLRHDHFGNATDSQPSEYRIFSRDVMAQRSELDGEPIWLQWSGQGNPLSELGGAAGLSTFCESTWTYAGLEYLIGRPTHHVACGDSGMWLDIETRLPLRSVRVQPEDIGPTVTFGATELHVGPQPASLFQPPDGVRIVTAAEHECASDPACQSPAPAATERPVITPAPAPGDLTVPDDLEAFVASVLSVYETPPGLEMVVDDGGFLRRYLSDGAGRSREEDGSGPLGSRPPWSLRTDGHGYERFGPDEGPISWQDNGPVERGGMPALGLGPRCDTGWEHHGFDLVVDRPAHHLVCGFHEYWIDDGWRLVTRHQQNPDPLGYDTHVEQVVELNFGPLAPELFQLPADACITTSRNTPCQPRPSGPVSPDRAGDGPALTWTRVAEDAHAISWLGGQFIAAAGTAGALSTSPDGSEWAPLAASDPAAAYAGILAESESTATWDDALVGWTTSSVRAIQPLGTAVAKSDFGGRIGAVGVGPPGIVARVHSGIDFDAFVTTFLGADWVGQIAEFEFADGVLHIATEDGRVADIVMADHGLGPGDVADRGYGWFSVDGAAWSVIPDFPPNVTEIVGVTDGFIARGDAIWHSPDGLTWTEIGPRTEGTLVPWQERAHG